MSYGKGRHTQTWYIRYRKNGKQHNESSHSTDRTVAERLLLQRLGDIAHNKWTPAQQDRVTWAELAADLVTEYRTNGRRSLDRLQRGLRHLREYFGDARAVDITTARVTEYKLARQRDGAANATINRELANLKRCYSLGVEHEKVTRHPVIKLLQEDNTRTGFFEREQFDALHRHLPETLQGLFTAAYITGWRIKSELCTRTWAHVDWGAGFLLMDVGEGKTRQGRRFPLTQALRSILEAQRAYTDRVQKESQAIVPWIFHRAGRPIRAYRWAWRAACKAAGVPDKIPHDFRRTAVRNLDRAGVSQSRAMALVGHKTPDMYRRYNITNEQDLTDAGSLLHALHEQEQRASDASVDARRASRGARGARK